MELKNKQIIIETTNICSAHCVICPREQYDQKPCTMDMKLFEKIINDAVQYNIESIDTCGFGDCLMDKDFFERLSYAKEKITECEIFISTTGIHMNQNTWDNILKYIDILKLSIHGNSKEVYEKFHSIPWEKAMGNILGFLSYSKYLDIRPYTIGLLVVTELNSHQQQEWIDNWEPKLDEVFIWTPNNWANDRQYREIDTANQFSCGRPSNGPMFIAANGDTSPCCYDLHKQLVMGNMNDQTIEEIYKGEPYKKLRKAHEDRNFKGYICEKCCQTNHDPNVLLYASNPDRKVGMLTSNMSTIKKD
jgi:radical SAM protein with 4Fe4S-binding SPASM domain